ncbi:hypothetical protein GCM10010124_26190 [Pilimelia terevasa]|uniref:Uncharacterized protein n=1 Tax=Pilimelia terevasa TaxID=53372 RepID=A0A8J3FK88_9ACTN|nr:hypothetical protein [Pilimelia terevasa]GGK32167.1 hypothetical protein GCM10010124_26190 [Pilimelia terevasa]
MSTFVALNVTTWVAGYDMTGDTNKTKLDAGHDPQDATTMTCVARVRRAGLRTVEGSVEGYWQAGTGSVDEAAITGLGGLQVVTHTPTGTVGDVSYSYQARALKYEMFGAVGEMVPFALETHGARGNGTLSVGAVRGRVLAAKGNISATGVVGAAYELGAVGAGQHLYATVHTFAIGTSFTLVIESDADNTFASATTRMTVGSITAAGGTWGVRVAGPVTDTWWRARVTAASGTSTIAVTAGIR